MDTGLLLGLGLNSSTENNNNTAIKAMESSFEPSLTLSLGSSHDRDRDRGKKDVGLNREDSGGSSTTVSVKREREIVSEESERVSGKTLSGGGGGDYDVEDDEGGSSRKKLRLTKPQSALLEEAFKLHTTLNPKQKQELARELKLRPRQVEVWFQNRRARLKLKQTEVDCEYLKKCCETLTEENKRLHKEVEELKSLKASQATSYMQLPGARLSMCPSCERVGDTGSATKTPFLMAPKPYFFNPFNNPPAAC